MTQDQEALKRKVSFTAPPQTPSISRPPASPKTDQKNRPEKMIKKRSPKVKKDNFGTKNEFVHTSGGKIDDFWRKLNLFTLLRKRCVFLTKNRFVHTSEKMSIFPENMRKPKEKTTFLKKVSKKLWI